MTDYFMIACRGDPKCKNVCLVPINCLSKELKKKGVETLQELADGFVCKDCKAEFENLFKLTLNETPE